MAHIVMLIVFWAGPPARAEEENVFGKKEIGAGALIGIIYDFKQDQKRQPTGITPNEYVPILAEFLDKGWDEAVLNRYFRAARPLYTTQIFIPMMAADKAPRAFGVQDVMKPSVWLVHYKGQVTPPQDGTYRFITYADDVIAVAINGTTACVGCHASIQLPNWKKPESGGAGKAGNGELVYGDWIPMKKSEPIDLDVIVGERPGGQFCAFLMYERKGALYPGEGKVKRYPIFKLAPSDTPDYQTDLAPLFSQTSEIWGFCQ